MNQSRYDESIAIKLLCDRFVNRKSISRYKIIIAIIAHAIVKEDAAVPDIEINRAIERQSLFVSDPAKHIYQEEQPDGEN